MICGLCGSNEGIDPFEDGKPMCLECFKAGLKHEYGNEKVNDLLYERNPFIEAMKIAKSEKDGTE